ncbi:MAG: hypothetical protein JJU02_14715, partial [Cryomorphaceae bacterium]|nr:hypothetical protein [Cryomorphaceae bacterium]
MKKDVSLNFFKAAFLLILLLSTMQLSAQQTWYTLNSGDWNTDPVDRWTLDPSGNLPDNPGADTPGVNDIVVILNGYDIEVNNSNKKVAELRVFGDLDLKNTTGHDFGKVEGSGIIRLASADLPLKLTDPFAEDQNGGRVVFYGDQNLKVNRPYHFYDLTINLDNATIIQLADWKVNNEMILQSGTMQINDDTSKNKLLLEVEQNFLINSGASLTVGEGDVKGSFSISNNNVPSSEEFNNIFHKILVKGSMTNNGSIKLTNQSSPVYDEFPDDGAVSLWFEGESNETFDINGQTYLYSLVINKGSDPTYELKMNSNNKSHFVLFGPSNVGVDGNEERNRKALDLYKGTLRLTGNFAIPTLTEGNDRGSNGDYRIPSTARLWIDGENVEIYSTANNSSQLDNPGPRGSGIQTGGGNVGLTVYGIFKMTDGFFSTRNSAGIIYRQNDRATVDIRGGLMEITQLRRSNTVSNGIFSYLQTGGRVIVDRSGSQNNNFALFDIESPDAVFTMTGGIIEIQNRTNNTPSAFNVASDASNVSITGGEILFNIQSGDFSFELSCACDFNDVTIKRRSGSGTVNAYVRNEFNAKILTLDDNVRFYPQVNADVNIYENLNLAENRSIFEETGGKLTFLGSENTNINIGSKSSWNDGAGTNISDLKVKNLIIQKQGNGSVTFQSPTRSANDSL